MGSSLALDQNFLFMLFRLCDFFCNFFHVTKDSSLHFLVFCNRTNVEKSQRVPSFRFFGTMRLLKILIFCFFFENFSSLASIFLKFCNRMDVKKISKFPPFTVFGIVRFFKSNIFLNEVFSGPARYIRFLLFFKDRCFFYAIFFLICFHRSPLNFY